MKSYLPDVNVWLALASRRHSHQAKAADWFQGLDPMQAGFCRVTQIGLLRLLTNRHVMGPDLVDSRTAWSVYDQLRRDERISFHREPSQVEEAWREMSVNRESASLWTDAYLAAFARSSQLTVVSFDHDFKRFRDIRAVIL